ncbi:MAG TPA: tail length tape measure protein [Bacteroides sp.]|nr:tail length tape measure protein [Bacteroides sp.]
MAIKTSIDIQDRVSQKLNRVILQLNKTTSAFQAADAVSNTALTGATVQTAAEQIYNYETRIEELEQKIEQAGEQMEKLKDNTKQSSGEAQNLSRIMGRIKTLIASYAGFNALQGIAKTSDDLTQTTARLGMMNEGFRETGGALESTDDLVNLVYASAQNARGSFGDMAAVVAKFGNNAKDAFSSSAEVVDFANLIQKQMTIAGASTQEASNAMLQLSQALGSGVLRGDELNSIFEQAPNLIQTIADYMDVPIGSIRQMASDGKLSADTVKAAIFSASEDINAKFDQMPMTWGQVTQRMKNSALQNFKPVLNKVNELAGNERFTSAANSVLGSLATVAVAALTVMNIVGAAGGFVADNWSIIGPIVYGVAGAFAVYAAYLGIVKGIEAASTAASILHSVAMSAKIGITALMTHSTMEATAAQMGYNGALYACPIVWIIVLIIALIAVIYAVCSAIAKMTGVANSGFGVITGGINVVIQFFKNLGLSVADIALGIGNAIAALASNMGTAFYNTICNVQSWFYNLLSTALSVIESICAALNKLPFVSFDYSNISSAADDYASKAAQAAGNKQEYKSVGDAFSEGMSVFDTFQDGWASDAFKAGTSWGDGLTDKVSGMFSGTAAEETGYAMSGDSGIGDNIGDIAEDTSKISKSVDISNENLKYLRDIAETEAVNRFTTAEIKVDMTNHNTVSSGMDIDGIVRQLSYGVTEAMTAAAEGVH